MTGARFLDHATLLALVLLSLALLVTVVRLWRGPSLPDRVLALDLLGTLAVGYVCVVALRTGFSLYVDIAIALALVGFVSTVAFARFILGGNAESDDAEIIPQNPPTNAAGRPNEAEDQGKAE